MIKQSEELILSKKLNQYLERKGLMQFELHGYTKFAQEYSSLTVERQNFNLNLDKREIWCATELCQPFLFINNVGELDISGVLNYDSEKQIGNFSHQTIDGILAISNVHSYHVFVNIQDHILPANSRYLPEYEETNDIYVSAIIKTGSTFKLKIFHNKDCIFEEHDVFPEEYIFYGENTAYVKRISYVRFAKAQSNTYHNFIYDIRNQILIPMDDSDEVPSWYIDYRKYQPPSWDRKRDDVIHGKSITIYLHLDESKTAQIISEYMKNTADKYKQIAIDDSDETINVEAIYKNKPESVRFLYYCAKVKKDLFGHALYGLSIDDLERGTKNNQFEYKNLLTYPYREMKYYKDIVLGLYKYYGEDPAINRLPLAVYEKVISGHDMITFMYQYLRDVAPKEYEVPWILSYMGKTDLSFDNEKKEYQQIFRDLAKREKLSVTWKTEYSLYTMIQKEYSDAIYQYHSEWLGRQSLDVFVPSENLAFEYQGRQHYYAVEFFGGADSLEKQQQRDKLKRKKCFENGVRLIEWRYDEPVTKLILDSKLKIK